MRPKSVLVAGGSGMIGTVLSERLQNKGYLVRILSRRPAPKRYSLTFSEWMQWDPESIIQSTQKRKKFQDVIEKTDILINLAGFPVVQGRLDIEHIRKVRESRLFATNALLQTCYDARSKPHTWIQASAIGYYGDRADEKIMESSSRGDLVLSDICEKWERVILNSKINPSTKIHILRIGMVLSKNAEAWKKILLPIKMGVGGALGPGNQWYSWIHIDDLNAAILFLISSDTKNKIFNLTAPEPIRQINLVKKIGKKIKRPSLFPIPSFAIRLLMGKVADELILSSCHVSPQALLDEGFEFNYPNMDTALNDLLNLV